MFVTPPAGIGPIDDDAKQIICNLELFIQLIKETINWTALVQIVLTGPDHLHVDILMLWGKNPGVGVDVHSCMYPCYSQK